MTQKGKEDVTATVTQGTTKFRADNYTTELEEGEAKWLRVLLEFYCSFRSYFRG